MTVNVYTRYSDSKCYVKVVASSVDITFTPTPPFGYLCRTVLPIDLSGFDESSHDLRLSANPLVLRSKNLLAEAALETSKIASSLHIRGINFKRLKCFDLFARRVSDRKLTKQFHLNLSGLNLNSIPFPIALFRKVRTLDLKNNDLRMVPKDILALPHLKEVDLRNNKIVELPDWCYTKCPKVVFHIDGIPERENYAWMFDQIKENQQELDAGSVACCDDVGV